MKGKVADIKRSTESAQREASRLAEELAILRATSKAEVEALQRCLHGGGEEPQALGTVAEVSRLQEELRTSRQEASDARREAERDSSLTEGLSRQLDLMKDTLQTVQAGQPGDQLKPAQTPVHSRNSFHGDTDLPYRSTEHYRSGDKEQRIITLTALLAAARSESAVLARRTADMDASTQSREAALSAAQLDCQRAQRATEDLELKLAVATGQAEIAGKRADALLAEAGTSEADLSRALQSARAQIVHMAAEVSTPHGSQ